VTFCQDGEEGFSWSEFINGLGRRTQERDDGKDTTLPTEPTEFTTWFRVNQYGSKIQKIARVIRETPQTITYLYDYYGGLREVTEYKQSQTSALYNDFVKARDAAIDYETRQIAEAKKQIEKSETEIVRLSLMTADNLPEEKY